MKGRLRFPLQAGGCLLAGVAALLSMCASHAGNPIVPNRGVNDPHIHIFGERAWLYASHDRSATNTRFQMDDWWVWSSTDLVKWRQECVISPEQTYIGRPYSGCWATDAAFRNGRYYFYFSERNQRAGVLVGDSPAGPWRDPLGQPLLDSDLTPTDEYDMCVFQDDDGTPYIVFGVWDYYIARLNEDMISLAESPRRIEMDRKAGPYGEGKLDDKPFVHKANGRYYLSWGCFYALSESVYGPYLYRGPIIDARSFAPGYEKPTWPHGFLQGRHGSFFEWHHQWYFAYCDISQTGNRYFRDTFVSYVHYRENGEIAPIRIDGIGVGEYDPERGDIEAEDYFLVHGITKVEIHPSGFGTRPGGARGWLVYPNIRGLPEYRSIALQFSTPSEPGVHIEIRETNPEGPLLASHIPRRVEGAGPPPSQVVLQFTRPPTGETLCLVFVGDHRHSGVFDSFRLQR